MEVRRVLHQDAHSQGNSSPKEPVSLYCYYLALAAVIAQFLEELHHLFLLLCPAAESDLSKP